MLEEIARHRIAALMISWVFRFLDALWPKDGQLLVFCGGHDVGYSDNSRFLFEKFAVDHSKEYEVVWVARNRGVMNDARIAETFRSRMLYLYSMDGLITLLRARVVFFSYGFGDLPGTSFSRRTITVQLWHGIPIKRIGRCRKDLPKHTIVPRMRGFSRFTYWITNSLQEKDAIMRCTGLPEERVVITGYPRNDYLVNSLSGRNTDLLDRYPFLARKVILYAPTYRRGSSVRFFPFEDFNLERLTRFLEDNDAFLVLRTHHVDESGAADTTAPFLQSGVERIRILNRDAIPDVQNLLPFVSIVISDYSGIWIDFLLLDRPLVFVPYDLAEYERNEGLLYDYEQITPGPKIRNFDEFINALAEYLKNPAKDNDWRTQVKCRFHQFEDGNAHQRICELIRASTKRNHVEDDG